METGRRGRRTLALLFAGSFALLGCAGRSAAPPAYPPPTASPSPAAAGAPTSPRSSTAVSYTQAQADHGRQVFNSVCSACHGVSEFRGQLFRTTWMARSIGDFFQHISTAMPQDNPGGLSPVQYAAVVAYVLQLNGQPAGDWELPADARLLSGFSWPR